MSLWMQMPDKSVFLLIWYFSFNSDGKHYTHSFCAIVWLECDFLVMRGVKFCMRYLADSGDAFYERMVEHKLPNHQNSFHLYPNIAMYMSMHLKTCTGWFLFGGSVMPMALI